LVVLGWLQIVAAQTGVGGGFFNGLLEEENKNCFEGHKHIDEKSIYCIELDHSKKPHRCVITTAKTLNHFTLGEAVQRCYYLSASLTQK
jgi:hypothetical protein